MVAAVLPPELLYNWLRELLGKIPPIQYCENQNHQIIVSEQYTFVFAILPPIESQGFGYSTQNKFDGCKKGKEEKPVALEETTNH